MKFEPLTLSHTNELLDFEINNKGYFEHFIARRESAFYTKAGVEDHIQQLINESSKLPFVLMDNSQIIARANVKNIRKNGSAEIGYRVAQNTIGKGVGSLCVKFLIEKSKNIEIKSLMAYVLNNNKASERVLTKSCFVLNLCLPNYCFHDGQSMHAFQYVLKFPG